MVYREFESREYEKVIEVEKGPKGGVSGTGREVQERGKERVGDRRVLGWRLGDRLCREEAGELG